MTSDAKLKTIIATLLPTYDVKLATGKTLEDFVAGDSGRKRIFITFDGMEGFTTYEDQLNDGIIENYRIFITDIENVQATARIILQYFQGNPEFDADNVWYSVLVGAGYFDNTFSQAAYIQNLQVQG